MSIIKKPTTCDMYFFLKLLGYYEPGIVFLVTEIFLYQQEDTLLRIVNKTHLMFVNNPNLEYFKLNLQQQWAKAVHILTIEKFNQTQLLKELPFPEDIQIGGSLDKAVWIIKVELKLPRISKDIFYEYDNFLDYM